MSFRRDPRCLILANPEAGGLAARSRIDALRRHGDPSERAAASLTWLAEVAAEVGLEANVERIPWAADLKQLIESAHREGFDTIVAAGGDGTVRAVAQYLVGTPLRLGILPVGTANNVARSLGISFELEEAMRVLARGYERQVDVGRVGEEYFLEAAGVGLFADSIHAMGELELRRHQVFRLLRTVWPLCWNPRALRLRIQIDGAIEQEEAVMVAVTNGPYLGEAFPFAPGADLQDGKLDVVILGALSRFELARFGLALLRRRHLELPKVRHAWAARVDISSIPNSRKAPAVHVDDHVYGRLPVTIYAVPAALRVLCPRPS